jgi:hypothetical protein
VTRKINCTSNSLVKRVQLHSCARVGRVKDGCDDPKSGGLGFQARLWTTAAIILVRDAGGSVGTVSSDSERRSGGQSMAIWKVSERDILTIQRIVRVSPEPRFVSSVSWHRASPQALTPRSFRPKHRRGTPKKAHGVAALFPSAKVNRCTD